MIQCTKEVFQQSDYVTIFNSSAQVHFHFKIHCVVEGM